MTHVWPLKFRPFDASSLLFIDDAGGFFRSDNEFLVRYANNALNDSDWAFVSDNGHSYSTEHVSHSRLLPIDGQDDNRYDGTSTMSSSSLPFAAI